MARGLLGHVRRNAVAYLALVIAMSGTSYAAVKLGANTVGTPQLKANAVTAPKVKNGSLKREDFAVGQVPQGVQGPPGAQGPKGDPGTTGAKGDPGAPATVLWAVIADAGTLARGKGVVSSGLTSDPGFYEVIFNQNVTQCAFVVGSGGTGTDSASDRTYSATRRGGNANGVFVVVRSVGTTPAFVNDSFHLAVFC